MNMTDGKIYIAEVSYADGSYKKAAIRTKAFGGEGSAVEALRNTTPFKQGEGIRIVAEKKIDICKGTLGSLVSENTQSKNDLIADGFVFRTSILYAQY